MRSLCTDPLNPCMSLGAMYAALGIHRCLPLSHGASGCCRFQRMEIARHFQRTVHVPSTMLNDRSAAYGGEAEFDEAVGNVFSLYRPDAVLAFTTCLSETIGDDMRSMVKRLDLPEGARVLWASTPSYAGSHLAGYDTALAAVIGQVAGGEACGRIASSQDVGSRAGSLLLVPGWVDPCDIGELDRLGSAFFEDTLVFPDTRNVLDVALPLDAGEYPEGGTHLSDLCAVGSRSAGLFVGHEATRRAMEAFGHVAPDARRVQVGLPIGVEATDALVEALCGLSDERPAPRWLCDERARAIDALLQQADLLYGKKVAIACDADLAVGLCSFAHDAGMEPVCVAVGDCDPSFEERVRATGVPNDCIVLAGADRHDLESFLADSPVDLIMGDSRNKRLAARYGAPLLRVGFPITDRPLRYVDSVLGYAGTLRLLRDAAGLLIDAQESGIRDYGLPIARYF